MIHFNAKRRKRRRKKRREKNRNEEEMDGREWRRATELTGSFTSVST